MRKNPKNVGLVAPHFPPSNLASVHRARLLSQHLSEFGWRPTIVTTHWKFYKEQLDFSLAGMVDPHLEVLHTRAFPTLPLGVVGDIGLRSLPWHASALRRMRTEGRLDFLLITIPSFYSAMLGEILYRDSPLPFGIDYIDPWVHVWPGSDRRYSKAWFSMKAANVLEPWAVKNASLITGVAEGYYESVFKRNPHLRSQAVSAAMPYGYSSVDFRSNCVWEAVPSEFDPSDGFLHLVYAGALLPKAQEVLNRFLDGLARAERSDPDGAGRLRVHFIGTGASPSDPRGFQVKPRAEQRNIGHMVTEHPHRMSYAQTLSHQIKADGILVLGSTEPHYTPSKVYQAVQSRRPVFALLHESSSGVNVIRETGAGLALTLTEDHLPEIDEVAQLLRNWVVEFKCDYDANKIHWETFEKFSARESARKMAEAMDEALEKFGLRTQR